MSNYLISSYNRYLLLYKNILNEDSNKISAQPNSIITKLKDHQLTSVCKMQLIENSSAHKIDTKLLCPNNNFYMSSSYISSRIGILADRVGSGKSLAILSIIALNPYLDNIDILENSNQTLINMYSLNKYIRTNIIVVPHNIIKQWEKYIRNETTLSLYVISRKNHIKDDVDLYNNINIILISSSQYNKFADFHLNNQCDPGIEQCIFSRIIYDEADTLAIPRCRQLNSIFYWFISSSVENLLFPKNHFYIKNTNKYINNYTTHSSVPGWRRAYVNGIQKTGFIRDTFLSLQSSKYIENIIVKCKDSYINKSYNIGKPIKYVIICKMDTKTNIVLNSVSKKILNMLNADNIDGVIKQMNITKDSDTNIIKIITNNIKKDILNKEKTIIYIQSIEIDQHLKENKIKKEQDSIKILKSRLNEINNKIKNYNNELCPICYDNFSKPITITNCCKNLFCLKCLTKTMCISKKQSCPMCRTIFKNNQDFCVIDNNHDNSKKVNNNKPYKIDALINILKTTNGKFLVFSSYDNTLHKIENRLQKEDISYSNISGNMYVIDNIIKKYKKGDIKVLLLNSQSYGTGMNLEMTTDIILYHKMKKNMEEQVIGRAQRVGRKSTLNVHYLYYPREAGEFNEEESDNNSISFSNSDNSSFSDSDNSSFSDSDNSSFD